MKILVLNCGSSSIKYKLFDMTDKSVIAAGGIEKIGLEGAFLKTKDHQGETVKIFRDIPEHTVGIQLILDTLDEAAIAIITLEEDKALNKAGLRKQMPSSFEIFKHDPFNRYKQAGILMHRWPSNFSSHHDKV